jgi:integrative and conjugative element protein (TIGR02256 family)
LQEGKQPRHLLVPVLSDFGPVAECVSETDPHVIHGDVVDADLLGHPLAKSLVQFVTGHGGRDVTVDAIYRIGEVAEAVMVTLATSTPQEPAHPILPLEQVVVFFYSDMPPFVSPTRRDFPPTPHSYGLPVEMPTSAVMNLCIDDRPWDDACGDYSGPELIYRIQRWLDRTATGEINDVLQAPDFAFLPAPVTIMMSEEVRKGLTQTDGAPYFVALRSADEEEKLFEAMMADEIKESPGDGQEWITYVGITLVANVTNTGAMWRAPSCLGHLSKSVAGPSFDLIADIRQRISELADDVSDDHDRLHHSKLIVEVTLANLEAERMEVFFLLTSSTIGEIGVALGLFYPPDSLAGTSFTKRLPAGVTDDQALDEIRLCQANHSRSFDSEAATFLSGRDENQAELLAVKTVVLGVGSIGSQVITSLTREGAFTNVVLVDDDQLAPHNLVRHTLRSSEIGKSKARSVANDLVAIRPDIAVQPLHEKFGQTSPSEHLTAALADADLVLDVTASVGASRQLADYDNRKRAVSSFFNPMGDAVVVLAEDQDRTIDLAQLEALYYAKVIGNEDLHGHLRAPNIARIGGGQCRSTTNRMSSSDAAILSGLAAKNISSVIITNKAAITIKTMAHDGSVSCVRVDPSPLQQYVTVGEWTTRVSGDVVDTLRDYRTSAHPDETGGVLLGIVDHSRKRIEVVVGLPASLDSAGTPNSFERGVHDLRAAIDHTRSITMDQIVYIGEWHTHPDNTRVDPSPIDAKQLMGLRTAMSGQQRPVVMLIVGDNDSNLIVEAVAS